MLQDYTSTKSLKKHMTMARMQFKNKNFILRSKVICYDFMQFDKPNNQNIT